MRPDALFLAWGPGGVSSARIGQGVLGLLLDARFGILPYVPLLLLAAAGLVLGGARRFAVILPAALAYYLTVASADNWSGAVCNLGRYVMPVAPLGVALVGIAIARTSHRRGAVTLVLALASWTALLALALRQDPHAANDSALLLAKSTYADGLQYIPGLFIRTWADAAPGLALRILAWLLLTAAAAFWLRRVARGSGEAGGSPLRTLAASRRRSCSSASCSSARRRERARGPRGAGRSRRTRGPRCSSKAPRSCARTRPSSAPARSRSS